MTIIAPNAKTLLSWKEEASSPMAELTGQCKLESRETPLCLVTAKIQSTGKGVGELSSFAGRNEKCCNYFE